MKKLYCTYKKEGNPNKKEKILAICHLLRNKKTITEVSKILFKAYNTIKNWWQAFKKDGMRGLETKKIPGRPPKIKNKTLLEFMEVKTKEEQYIVPENIARDLKTKFGVDYSLSGMRNASPRLHMQDHGTPAFKHAVRRGCSGVAARHEKVVFTPKKTKSMFGSTTPPHSDTISPAGSACGHWRGSAYLAIIVGIT